jgi:hypothetical protein
MTIDPSVAGAQTPAAVTPVPTPREAPAILDQAQRLLLRAVLNRIVPPGSELSGAGDLDVGASIERTLAASPALRRLFLDGLAAIAVDSPGFVDLAPEHQVAALERIERDQPAFFTALIEHTYRGYYTLQEVQLTLGSGARPPQPLGYQLPPFDPSLLDQQRQRAPFWRRT